jgi:hypothetical protein
MIKLRRSDVEAVARALSPIAFIPGRVEDNWMPGDVEKIKNARREARAHARVAICVLQELGWKGPT